MPLIKNRAVVENDPWLYVTNDQAVPASGDVLVTLARYLEEHDALGKRTGRVGVVLEPTDELVELVPHLSKLGLVAVNFPKFGDGRGYSKARLLRERHGYKAEIRAIGEVLTDQLFYLYRCGFDAFQLVDGRDVGAALRAFEEYTATYQAAVDDSRPLYRRVARGRAGA